MSRRFINTVTSALMLIGLGFVIAVSARSMPGDDGQETLGDISFTVPDWVGSVFVWVSLAVAGALAAYVLLAIRRGGTWADLGRVIKRVLTVIIWAAGFYLIYAITRPPVEEASAPPPPQLEPDNVADLIDVKPSLTASWVAAVLVILIIAAVLIRVALTLRNPKVVEDVALEPATDPVELEELAEPLTIIASDDPRSRVINTYAEFELFSMEAGLGRTVSETARHHARRAGAGLGAEPGDLRALGDQYERARFAEATVDVDNAEKAEIAWHRIRSRLRR